MIRMRSHATAPAGPIGGDRLAQRVRSARLAGGINSRELDRLAGLAEGHVSLIETGKKKNITVRTAERLALTMGVSLDWLLKGRGKRPTAREVREAAREAYVRCVLQASSE